MEDQTRLNVQKFNSSGSYISKFSVTNPNGVGVDMNTDIWDAACSSGLKEYNSSGSVIATYNAPMTD